MIGLGEIWVIVDTRRRTGLASRVPRGVRAQGMHTKGVRPGTWENPEISAVKSRLGSG